METMIRTLGKNLYERDIYGFISIDFISFPDPYKTNENPLFWANGLTTYYTSFNTIQSFNEAANSKENPFVGNAQRSITAIPFISQKALPSIHFRSFFHLARLENMFFDISTKRGIIFLVADSLQAGTIGIICSDVDRLRSFKKVLKCMDFLRKQNVENQPGRFGSGMMQGRGDLVPFGEIYGGVKIIAKSFGREKF